MHVLLASQNNKNVDLLKAKSPASPNATSTSCTPKTDNILCSLDIEEDNCNQSEDETTFKSEQKADFVFPHVAGASSQSTVIGTKGDLNKSDITIVINVNIIFFFFI